MVPIFIATSRGDDARMLLIELAIRKIFIDDRPGSRTKHKSI